MELSLLRKSLHESRATSPMRLLLLGLLDFDAFSTLCWAKNRKRTWIVSILHAYWYRDGNCNSLISNSSRSLSIANIVRNFSCVDIIKWYCCRVLFCVLRCIVWRFARHWNIVHHKNVIVLKVMHHVHVYTCGWSSTNTSLDEEHIEDELAKNSFKWTIDLTSWSLALTQRLPAQSTRLVTISAAVAAPISDQHVLTIRGFCVPAVVSLSAGFAARLCNHKWRVCKCLRLPPIPLLATLLATELSLWICHPVLEMWLNSQARTRSSNQSVILSFSAR